MENQNELCIDSFRKAGLIHKLIRQALMTKVKPGVSFLTLVDEATKLLNKFAKPGEDIGFAFPLGISVNAPEYLNTLQSFMKIYISLFLIYRFNPFRHVKFTELDAKITFSAGIFLLGTTAIDGIVKNYISTFKDYLQLVRYYVF